MHVRTLAIEHRPAAIDGERRIGLGSQRYLGIPRAYPAELALISAHWGPRLRSDARLDQR
jgi:hypothetical protein